MKLAAHAKINLSLRVLGRRPDGFHEIDTLMCAVGLADTLTLAALPGPGLEFTCDDPTLPTDDANLAVRAARLFAEATGRAPAWSIRLEKRIPHGAGLGGGSADAAATLLGLDALAGTRLAPAELSEIGARLGSDVPFFFNQGPARATGRGETVAPAPLPPGWLGRWILLLRPPFGVPTPWAYQNWRDSREIPGHPHAPQTLDGITLVNDLERPVFAKHLFLGQAKRWLLDQPETRAALMSGSGSSLFALVHDQPAAAALADRAKIELDPALQTWATRLQSPSIVGAQRQTPFPHTR